MTGIKQAPSTNWNWKKLEICWQIALLKKKIVTVPDVLLTLQEFWHCFYDLMKNYFLQPSQHLLLLSQGVREPGMSVSLVVRKTQIWGSRSVNKVMGPISKMRMVSWGSLTCPQAEKYFLCTFRKKSSTRNPSPLHQDSMARLSTQSFSLWYLLQKNIEQRTPWLVLFSNFMWCF